MRTAPRFTLGHRAPLSVALIGPFRWWAGRPRELSACPASSRSTVRGSANSIPSPAVTIPRNNHVEHRRQRGSAQRTSFALCSSTHAHSMSGVPLQAGDASCSRRVISGRDRLRWSQRCGGAEGLEWEVAEAEGCPVAARSRSGVTLRHRPSARRAAWIPRYPARPPHVSMSLHGDSS